MGQISTAASGILTGYSTQYGSIVSVAGGILCLAQLFTPEGLAGLTSGILSGLNAAAGEVIAGLLDFVSTTIANTVAAITGIISTQLAIIGSFIQDIAQTIALIIATVRSLDDIAKATLDYLKSAANCNFNAAELGRCIAASVVADITRKAAPTIIEGTLAFENRAIDATTNLLGTDTAINNFVYRSQMFANKAAIQQQF